MRLYLRDTIASSVTIANRTEHTMSAPNPAESTLQTHATLRKPLERLVDAGLRLNGDRSEESR